MGLTLQQGTNLVLRCEVFLELIWPPSTCLDDSSSGGIGASSARGKELSSCLFSNLGDGRYLDR
uniref:Uncharacterized protein n=1 Tax=Nelumbo nucifera TaxID=4432 RepID=A0A822YG91_NELNU|nr:TPA_asm: hypothetical protein HUJ06_010024 [Nelumbo nucifera]